MRTRFLFLSCLLLYIHILNAQPALLKEQVLKSVLRYQEEGLVNFSSKQLSTLKNSPSRFDTSWKSSGYFQLAIRMAYTLSVGKPSKPWLIYESIAAELEKAVYQRLNLALEKVQTHSGLRDYFEFYRLPRSSKLKRYSAQF